MAAVKKETETEAKTTSRTQAKAETAAKAAVEATAPSSDDVMVTINLFKDDDKYKDDLVVGINGKIYQIKRGVDVKVPLSVAEIINNSIRQDKNTAKKIEEAVSKYQRQM